MQNTLKIVLVAGARPNFMKVAPLIRAIQRHNEQIIFSAARSNSQVVVKRPIEYKLVHTGQHYDSRMSDVFFRELGIPAPDFNLEVGSGSHAVQTANIMLRFEPVLLTAFNGEKPENFEGERLTATSALPDWLVVVGDVNSTMACTLVASKLGVKVAHVEAGLRSFDRTMPEEINRLVTDALADLLLTPSEDGNENLRKEGVPESKIRLVGNIMIDALIDNIPAARKSRIMELAGISSGNFVYVTLHRPSNVDHRESLSTIMGELRNLSQKIPVVFPMHPRTRKMLETFGISVNGSNGLRVIEPVGYQDSLCLTENARLVLTDSGGLQEESTYFRTPCLTLRPNTERPVTVTIGSNRLTTQKELQADMQHVLKGGQRVGKVPSLWDGNTAIRILTALVEEGLGAV